MPVAGSGAHGRVKRWEGSSAGQGDQPPDGLPVHAFSAQILQTRRTGALGQLAAVRTMQQPMMVIDRFGQIEQNLQQAVQVGGSV